MAEVSSSGIYVQPRITSSYFPTIPPSAPKATISYQRSVQIAPYTALQGVIVDARVPERHPVMPRCRMRRQVGQTNRWRLPESLGSDLLGSSQAIRSVTTPYNQTLVNIITAESAHMNMNLDMSQPYKFRQSQDRPATEPAFTTRLGFEPGTSTRQSRTPSMTSALKSKEAPATAPIISRGPRTLAPLKMFVPANARPVTPKEMFLYHSKRSKNNMGPDVLLRCLGMDWELHRPFLQKSETLTTLLKGADDPTPQLYYKSPASETLDTYIKKSNFYSNEYREMSNRLSTVEGVETQPVQIEEQTVKQAKKVDHPAHISEKRVNNVTVIHWDVHDPAITKTALAIALGNMYHDDIDVDREQLAGVLAAASLLQFKALIKGIVADTFIYGTPLANRVDADETAPTGAVTSGSTLFANTSNHATMRCVNLMLLNINTRTVCKYHDVASRHQQDHVVLACERWLELNLIPDLSNQIQLRQMPMELLQKVLKSNRLFVTNEHSVYRTLSYWLFLQLNPHLQMMPSHSTVISYFNSLPKTTSFIERDDGQLYDPLFSAVRLHGITDTGNIQDMQLMNILPREKLIDLLSQHYHALQGGGDMSVMKNFNTGAIRQGFIIDNDPLYHSEVMSLHGFHFELKAVGNREGKYTVFMQRLKPGDPILSFRQCERTTFSMRADREVRYCITVQYVDEKGENQIHTTGIQSQKFGTGEKTSKSEVIQMEQIKKPLFVEFSVLFPSS